MQKDFTSDLPNKTVVPDEQQVLQDGEEMRLGGRVLHQTVHRVKHVSHISAGRIKEHSRNSKYARLATLHNY